MSTEEQKLEAGIHTLKTYLEELPDKLESDAPTKTAAQREWNHGMRFVRRQVLDHLERFVLPHLPEDEKVEVKT